MVLTLATAVRNAKADAAVATLNAGTTAGLLRIYSGARPADPQTAPAVGNTLLAEVVLADPAGPAAVDGVVTFTNPAPVTAVGDGTASWARFTDSAGAAKFDGTVTADGGGGEVTFPTLTFSTGLEVDMGTITYTQPA